MQRNILILGYDISSNENIYHIIENLHKEVVIYTAYNVKEAYAVSIEHQIHLFIMDIVLEPQKSGDISGFKFAQEMRNIKKYEFIPIIFVTSLEDPKLYSYSHLGCLGYVEKPFDEDLIKKYIIKALNFPVITDRERYIFFRKEGILYSKCLKDIYFIEVSRRKIIVNCEKDILEIPYKTCSEILKELDSPLFIQCSRYSIVNRDYIEQIDYARRFLKLKNINKTIEIGSVMKKRFKTEVEKGINII